MKVTGEKLYDAKTWGNPQEVYAILENLRKNDPVHLCKHPDYSDFWHVTKQADIFTVERSTDSFLAAPRLWLNTKKFDEAVRVATGGSLNVVKGMPAYDPPKHPQLRAITQAMFMPKYLQAMQDKIDISARKALDKLNERNGACDFATDVALDFPLRVILDVLGLPEEDFPQMLRLSQEFFGADDPEAARDVADKGGNILGAKAEPIMEFGRYFGALLADRRAKPRDDLATVIANAEINGAPIESEDAIGYYVVIATAGHDTTSYSLTEAVRQLALEPKLFKRLKDNPDEIAPKITEEAIRFAAPVRHFTRIACKDFELGGKTIRKGDCVILWYPSGSRDEDVVSSPNTFDIDRDGKLRHAAFGHGPHLCLGMHLARLEISTFLKRFARDVETIDLNGDIRYLQSTTVGGIKSMPIKAEFSSI